MNRRNFIKISALSSLALTLTPSSLIENKEIEFNAILKNNIIKFNKKQDVRIGDFLLISDGVNENKYIVTKHKKDMIFELVQAKRIKKRASTVF